MFDPDMAPHDHETWKTIQALRGEVEELTESRDAIQRDLYEESDRLREARAWARTLLDEPAAHEDGCPKRTFRVQAGDPVRIEDRPCRCVVGRIAGVV